MSLTFVIESFKFYKLKDTRLVQGLFLLAFALNFLLIAFPMGDRDFSNLLNYAMALVRQPELLMKPSRLLPAENATGILTFQNLLFLLGLGIRTLLNGLMVIFYATLMQVRVADYPREDGIRNYFKKLPSLILFFLLLVVPYIFSFFFIQLPFYILLSFLAFTPLFLIDRGLNMSQAMDLSLTKTYGLKFQMVVAFIILNYIISLPSNLLFSLLGSNGNMISGALIKSFFQALQVMMAGRLYGLFYTYRTRMLGFNPGPWGRDEAEDMVHFLSEINRKSQIDNGDSDNDDDEEY